MKKFSVVLGLVMIFLLAMNGFAGGRGDAGNNPIRIGFYADLSAGTAVWGTDAEKGARLKVEEVNAAGGVLGRPVELVVYDIGLSPTEAVRAYTRLVQVDRVVAVQGSLISSTALAVQPVTDSLRVPVVSRAMDERVTTPGFDPDNPERVIPPAEFFFLTQPSAFQQSRAIVCYAIHVLGMETFAMLYTPDNAYSLYLAKGFEHAVRYYGRQMLGTFQFREGDLDFRPQLTRVRELNPDGLFVNNYLVDNANAVRQARELGVRSRFLGNNSWYRPMDEVAGVAADGSYFPMNFGVGNPRLQNFIRAYRARWGEDPRLHSFSGYDDIGIIIDAIRRAGSDDPRAIATALRNTRGYRGVVADITIDPQIHRPVDISMAILRFVGDQIETAEYEYIPRPRSR